MTRKLMTFRVAIAVYALLLSLFTTLASAADYVTYLHVDVQGSPLVATDEQGNVAWREDYEPWGAREVKDTASASASRGGKVWYTGKEEEASLGMYYYGARWYVPEVGQFTAMDPAGVTLNNPRSFSRYAYANNNPVRYVDPNGESPIDVAFLIYDVGRFCMAVYSGKGVGAAAVDVGMSVVGVLSPVPGTGQVLKAARTAERLAEAGRAVEHAAEMKRASEAAELAARNAEKSETFYHYTDEAGAKAIKESGVILPNKRGQVFITKEKLSPSEVKDVLFTGRSGTKGTHVVTIEMKSGAAIEKGKNANEFIHQGAIRDGRQGNFSVKENGF